jgi:hypothetical protein
MDIPQQGNIDQDYFSIAADPLLVLPSVTGIIFDDQTASCSYARRRAASGAPPAELSTLRRSQPAPSFVRFGKKPAYTKATRVEEKLTAVMIREAHSKPAIPSCPQ